jgi:futalosine hydrolase
MKKVLIVAATDMELSAVRKQVSLMTERSDIHFLVTGVGMVNTCFALTQYLLENEPPQLILNLGIAGSFHSVHAIGDVVQVVADRFSELGAEDRNSFLPADKMGLVRSDEITFNTDIRVEALNSASGITVNTVHGSEASIERIRGLFNPDIESMEGAAVAYVAKKFKLPWIQLRAISNRVEARNREAWDIPVALKNLSSTAIKILPEL